MKSSLVPKAVSAFFAVTEFGLAIAIIAVICSELYYSGGWDVYYNGEYVGYWGGSVCLMTTNSINTCAYGISTAVISFFISVPLFVLAIMGSWMPTLLLSLFSTVWWLAWCITAQVYSDKADDVKLGDWTSHWTPQAGTPLAQLEDAFSHGLPHHTARVQVTAMSWTVFALSVVTPLLALWAKKAGHDKSLVKEEPVPVYPPTFEASAAETTQAGKPAAADVV